MCISDVVLMADEVKNTEWDKHQAIAELLGIDLKCPHCNEVLKENDKGRTLRTNDKSSS